jgi:hypothetical protein
MTSFCCLLKVVSYSEQVLALLPFSTPTDPGTPLALDYIDQLPLSNGYTATLVVIDRLSKESIFIPTTDNTAANDVTDAFVTHDLSKHGIPLHVSSDRGSESTSIFLSLRIFLQMRLHFTSGHHASANCQNERLNSALEQYLRIYCNYEQGN